MKEIFTIGYSTYSLESFLRVLEKYSINAIADVRSIPYSKFKPDFNRDFLEGYLSKKKMAYVFLGDNCGARINAPECYVDGKADYHLIAEHPTFREGLKRLRSGINNKYRIVLMCAEADPVNCHRSILVCRNLRFSEIRIKHILKDGSVEDHQKTEKRLMNLFNLYQPNLFKTESDRLEDAYALQGEKISYRGDGDLEEKNLTGGVGHVSIKLFTIGFTKKKCRNIFYKTKKCRCQENN